MRALTKWYVRNFLSFDIAVATFLVATAALLLHIFVGPDHLGHVLDGIRTALYGTASAGCAALLGFIITMTTITDAVMQNTQWEKFRKSLAYSEVQDIYFDTIRWLGISTLLFLVFLIVDTDDRPQLLCEVFAIWLVCVLVSRMWRSIDALETLLRMNSFKMKSKD